MHLTTRNVNSAFHELVKLLANADQNHAWTGPCGHVGLVRRPSRNGNVLMIDEPVTITYTHPRERVLFNPARDANPFFHLYEALWMLAGRNDVDSVAYYAKQMREYSDDGETLNGAYGYRWRGQYLIIETEIPPSKEFPYGCRESEAKRIDQLDILVNHLKAQPESRRAVLQMWNVEDDLMKIGQPKIVEDEEKWHPHTGTFYKTAMTGASKDVCCNLSVMFSLRTTVDRATHGYEAEYKYLDMTVTNRSNDLIWGLLGANFVHFTILQEYMAARLGAEVGVYHHFTNNLHAYDWNWRPEEWLSADKGVEGSAVGGPVYLPTKNDQPTWNYVPLVKDPAMFDRELPSLVGNAYGGGFRGSCPSGRWNEPFFTGVAGPVFRAFESYKEKDYVQALRTCESIAADDWRIACTNWLQRRMK